LTNVNLKARLCVERVVEVVRGLGCGDFRIVFQGKLEQALLLVDNVLLLCKLGLEGCDLALEEFLRGLVRCKFALEFFDRCLVCELARSDWK